MAETKTTTAKKTTSTSTAAKKTTSTPATAKPETAKPVETAAPEVKKEVKESAPAKKADKKAEKKVEKAPKPLVTEARAIARDVRVTPRKVRLVIDLVRGKNVADALGILANVNKAASPIVAKVIKSAAANAMNNFGFDEERLYIAQIWANDGIKMRRFLPRAKGSASGLVKRASTITVVIKER